MRTATILAVSLFCCLALVAGASSAGTQGVSIIFSESFEDDDIGACPDGWTCRAIYGHAYVVDSVACDGDKSLEIHHGTSAEDENSISYRGLDLGCLEPYTVELCLTSSNVDSGSDGISLMTWVGFFYVNTFGFHIRDGKFAWTEGFDIHEIAQPLPVSGVSYNIKMEFEPPDSLRFYVDGMLVDEATAAYGCDEISALFLKVAWGRVATAHFDNVLIYRGEPEPGLVAEVEFAPSVLNCKGNGKYVGCHLEPPAGFDAADIDVSSVMLNGQVQAESHPTSMGDHDGDGIADMMVKFQRASVMALTSGAGEFEARVGFATLDGTSFEGADTLRIKCKERHGKSDDMLSIAQAQGESSALIRYSLEAQENVGICVYDVRGRLIRTLVDEVRPAGDYSVTWNGDTDYGTQVASGVYFIKVETSGDVMTGKALVIK